jgi:HAD superfamily hydrolase (TIGR01509 family)
MIRALVFDFDGLILDTETPAIDVWAEMHAEAGLAYAREHALKTVGHVDVPYDPWQAFDAAADREALQRDYRIRTRARLEKQPILPGIIATLSIARGLGLRTAIASNSPHSWIDRHLARLGLAESFDTIKCRDDVGRAKPEPDVYLAVLKTLGVSGKEAIAFEDSEAGSQAAKRAGLWCVAIPNPSTRHHHFDHVDVTLTSLSDQPLTELLERWQEA